jgi:hypothetical protein
MTPVEWNDSEPGFPDFLPPKLPWMTPEEGCARIEGVLRAAGIKAYFRAEDVEITFPDGELCLDDFTVLVDGYTRT